MEVVALQYGPYTVFSEPTYEFRPEREYYYRLVDKPEYLCIKRSRMGTPIWTQMYSANGYDLRVAHLNRIKRQGLLHKWGAKAA